MKKSWTHEQKTFFWYGLTFILFLATSIVVFAVRNHVRLWVSARNYVAAGFMLLIVAFALVTIRMMFLELNRRGKLRGLLQQIAELGLIPAITRNYFASGPRLRSPALRLAFWGVLILAFILLLSSNGILFEKNLALLEYVDEELNPHSSSAGFARSPVNSLFVSTSGLGMQDRFRAMLKLALDLKSEGAKAVVFEIPRFIDDSISRSLAYRMQETGIVVFAEQGEDYGGGMLQTQVFSIFRPLPADSSEVAWGVISLRGSLTTAPYRQGGYFCSIVPYAYRDVASQDTIADITLEVVRKLENLPASLKPIRQDGRLVFGSLRMPLIHDEFALQKGARRWSPLPFTAHSELTRSLKYIGSVGYPQPILENLDRFKAQIMGKAIMVIWYDPIEMGSPFSRNMWNASAFMNWALTQDFITYRESVDLFVSVAVVFLACFIAMRFRGWLAVLLILALAVTTLAFGTWRFLGYSELIDIIYPLVAALVCTVVLPLARLSADIHNSLVEEASITSFRNDVPVPGREDFSRSG